MSTQAPIAYIVTTGEYSDYRIVGVFLEREHATEFVQGLTGNYSLGVPRPDACEIEEWPIGLQSYLPVWEFEMSPVAGNTRCWKCVGFGPPQANVERNGRYFECCVAATTKEAAAKIANEKRRQWLAEEGQEKP